MDEIDRAQFDRFLFFFFPLIDITMSKTSLVGDDVQSTRSRAGSRLLRLRFATPIISSSRQMIVSHKECLTIDQTVR